jgi:hypothetical protein
MKRVAKKKLILDRNVVKILGRDALRDAAGGLAITGDGEGSIYPACPTTHASQALGDCPVVS